MDDKQKNLHEFLKDPKNIAKAVEGSMDKRNAVMADTKAEEVTNGNILRYYWGIDWPGEEYPEWELIEEYEREQLTELNEIVKFEIAKARTELLDELEKEKEIVTDKYDNDFYAINAAVIEAARKRIGEEKR